MIWNKVAFNKYKPIWFNIKKNKNIQKEDPKKVKLILRKN